VIAIAVPAVVVAPVVALGPAAGERLPVALRVPAPETGDVDRLRPHPVLVALVAVAEVAFAPQLEAMALAAVLVSLVRSLAAALLVSLGGPPPHAALAPEPIGVAGPVAPVPPVPVGVPVEITVVADVDGDAEARVRVRGRGQRESESRQRTHRQPGRLHGLLPAPSTRPELGSL